MREAAKPRGYNVVTGMHIIFSFRGVTDGFSVRILFHCACCEIAFIDQRLLPLLHESSFALGTRMLCRCRGRIAFFQCGKTFTHFSISVEPPNPSVGDEVRGPASPTENTNRGINAARQSIPG